jgi:predicted small lipoprotein YifL
MLLPLLNLPGWGEQKMRIDSGTLCWVFVVGLLLGGLSGCGQKGDLYLPESQQSSLDQIQPDRSLK